MDYYAPFRRGFFLRPFVGMPTQKPIPLAARSAEGLPDGGCAFLERGRSERAWDDRQARLVEPTARRPVDAVGLLVTFAE
jgi:hypothetical protein